MKVQKYNTADKKRKYNKRRRKIRKKKLILLAALMAVFCIAVFISIFTIRSIEIEGNEYYTEEEVKQLIFTDFLSKNSLYLNWKYRSSETDLPFISAIEVEVLSPQSVKIRVYEKSIVGYITYMGTNMYFDKDGIVVESTSEVYEDIPQINGITFDQITLYQKISVKEEGLFENILTLTQLLEKSEITPNKIYYDSELDVTLYFDDVRVKLGGAENLEVKISELYALLPEFEGLSGELDMENYSGSQSSITFQKDN